ncbi:MULTISPECIES: MMPL family transporter [Metallosphaera]|uniref:Drug exporter of the RND superfamily-like protein n=3 Tax=Metallosphaera TaxID=41980 RepID=A4YIQ4_METS5|nr:MULTISPECIES: MMPL family transporter [Metallosphaera]ABP96306.1 drug exporter of the RND superfamily-like protein [Metallosphaera sedula DSM 5348]AIM28289.1 drug exporter of the RND superfamily-like protein [Metallosphaera sedula]AKV75092.1 antibiotic transporter [Metallosphaera sedula]AKV77331.1 antibiotic transporter [Metallosphaera sedula]AKV79581.1 antibiotic transporter [Metallosphaera sedula]
MKHLAIAWIVLMVILAPVVLQVQNYFVYSDSPFLSSTYQSIVVENLVKDYFNLSQTSYSEIYVIVNGSYNESLDSVESNLHYLQDARIITPYEIISQYQQQYLQQVSPLINSTEAKLLRVHQLYLNLTELRNALLDNISNFMCQLNVTYGVPLGKNVNAPANVISTYKTYYFLALQNLSQINASRLAGYLTFKDPYVIFFGYNNYTNETLVRQFLLNFNNYSILIRLLTGEDLPPLAYENPHEYAVQLVEREVPQPGVSLSYFHRNNSWLFIVQVPRNESLSSINIFMENLHGVVTGHLPIYAQSELYTEQNLRIIDVVTVTLVGVLLILLLRSLVPILLLVGSALIGVEVAYASLLGLRLLGYQIYYISGLVIPPIVFGIAIDYSLLFIYRYFEELRAGSKNPLTTAFRTAGRGALFSGLSITLAFASFLLSPSPLLRNIGIALVLSSVFSLLPSIGFTYTTLREISVRALSFPRREIPNPSDSRSRYLRFMVNLSIRRKYLVVVFMVISSVLAMGVFLTHTTNINANEIVPSFSESLVGLNELTRFFNYSLDYAIIKGNPNSTYSFIYNVSAQAISRGALVYGPASLGKVAFSEPTALTNKFYSHGYTLVEFYVPYPVFSDGAINFTTWLISKGLQVGGSNAQRIDIVSNTVHVYYSLTLPLTILFILVYLGVLLRSVALPIRLVLSLLFSSLVGVAVMFLVFGSVYWLSPLIVFALLFSLGIDYDMFIVLRIREEQGTEDERIRKGVEKTGLVVTAAGLVLTGAFISLTAVNMQFLREIGFAVGFSILFDTFIVRPFIVPAVMSILGKYNWWPGVRRTRNKA